MKEGTMKSFVLGCLAFCICSTFAFATGGRIPIYQGVSITQDGSYYLTRDISGSCTTSSLIVIQAKNVSLDLNGHTLSCSGSGTVVEISLLSGSNISIFNGTIKSANTGISASSTLSSDGSVHYYNLLISEVDRGIYLQYVKSGVIERVQAVGTGTNGTEGIYIDTAGNIEVSQTIIRDFNKTGSSGIFVKDVKTLSFHHNALDEVQDAIWLVGCLNCSIENNIVLHFAWQGIYCNSGTSISFSRVNIRSNKIFSPGGTTTKVGVRVLTGCSASIQKNAIEAKDYGVSMDSPYNEIRMNFLKNSTFCLQFNTGSDRNVYIDNVFINCSTNVVDNGTSNVDSTRNTYN